MSDRRLTPANGRVAARSLEGQVAADRFVDPEAGSIGAFASFLHAKPDGARDRQLLLGDVVQIYERRDGWAFVQADKDGYVGWIRVEDLSAPHEPTHKVDLRHTLAFPAPDMKTPPLYRAPFGARVVVFGEDGIWSQIRAPGQPDAWMRRDHLSAVDAVEEDPIAVARVFLGSPYLWGGNTGDGLDCSGLVQATLLACGVDCPGDSDLIEKSVGTALGDAAPLQRGDLIFWKGHVAMAMDATRIIHATSAPLMVVIEDVEAAIARIAKAGDGFPTSRRRVAQFRQLGSV